MEEWNRYKKFSVLMTTDTIGGVWTYSMELCKALQPYDVHFYLVTTGAPMMPHQKAEVAELANVEVYETEFLLEWMDDPWESIDRSGKWLLALADQLKPGVIHLNGYSYGSLPWKVPTLVVAHSDVFSWWLNVKQAYPPAGWNEYFRRVSRGLQSADYVIAPSHSAMAGLRKIFRFQTPCKVIYNGRSSRIFYASSKEKVAFSMGRIWDEAKNIRLIVEAAATIRHDIRLAGDTSFAGDSCNTRENNIVSLGRLPQQSIAKELSAAAVYVLPAKYEPFGLSVLEAALSGCALVLGNINSLKEIWHDCALYVDTDDANALAKTVNSLLENEEACVSFGRKAMHKAKEYRVALTAYRYLHVYTMLLRNKNQLISEKNI